jgi:superfamily II DNA or RNA helicase
VLIFAAHATVANALSRTLLEKGITHGLVTGSLTTTVKADVLRRFMAHQFDVLVGTASLATGTDGLDKMCDWLLILDDTEDDSMRRQLIGRIMPRGLNTDASQKHVIRVVQQ